jgi:hypothetical protein
MANEENLKSPGVQTGNKIGALLLQNLDTPQDFRMSTLEENFTTQKNVSHCKRFGCRKVKKTE